MRVHPPSPPCSPPPPRPALPCPALPRPAPLRPIAPTSLPHQLCPTPSAHGTAHTPTRGLCDPAWCVAPQAKEMLLMAEEAVGDRKLEGRLTLRQLRRYLSSSLHTGAPQRT